MNDPRLQRHNTAVTKTRVWERWQAFSQSVQNRRQGPKFTSQRPLMPPVQVQATQAASAAGRHRPTAPLLPPTANQRATQAHLAGPFVQGGGGYAATTVPQHLVHRRYTERGPG